MAEVLTDDGTAYDRSVDLILNEALRSETRMLCGDVADGELTAPGYAELSGPRASASVAAWDPSAKVTLRREGDEGSENDDDQRLDTAELDDDARKITTRLHCIYPEAKDLLRPAFGPGDILEKSAREPQLKQHRSVDRYRAVEDHNKSPTTKRVKGAW
ncbi:hypothetical protein MBLNU459_g8297t1 [Dothideomycetes sp. NU459]